MRSTRIHCALPFPSTEKEVAGNLTKTCPASYSPKTTSIGKICIHTEQVGLEAPSSAGDLLKQTFRMKQQMKLVHFYFSQCQPLPPQFSPSCIENCCICSREGDYRSSFYSALRSAVSFPTFSWDHHLFLQRETTWNNVNASCTPFPFPTKHVGIPKYTAQSSVSHTFPHKLP